MREKISCSNNRGESLLLAAVKELQNADLSRFATKSPFQCRFCCGLESRPSESAGRKVVL